MVRIFRSKEIEGIIHQFSVLLGHNEQGHLVSLLKSGTIGEIVDEADYGGNLVITVETAGGDVLLPIHEDLIVSIHDDVITLDIPEGLF